MTIVFETLAAVPLATLFLLVGLGMLVGHAKIKGIALGAAAVLFVGIGVAAAATSAGVEIRVPHELSVLGLMMFTFAIGVNSGSEFFDNLKRAAGPLAAVLGALSLAAVAALVVGKAMGMSVPLIGGTFSGALTNTPALAAASEASGDAQTATVGYAIAYIFGVLGMLGAALLALRLGPADDSADEPIINRTVRIDRATASTFAELAERFEQRVSFSRFSRNSRAPVEVPAPDDQARVGDLVTVVGPADAVEDAERTLGHCSSHRLQTDSSGLDFRRITVSSKRIVGSRIETLELEEQLDATITRVRRGDTDVVATPEFQLQAGDRVRVVAPAHLIDRLSAYFGDSERGAYSVTPIALGLGMALGALIGETSLTWGDSSLKIGAAAGCLLVGLVFGRIGRIGRFVTAVPHVVCNTLSEFGLLIFLAAAGLNAGGQIAVAITSGAWSQVMVLGIVVTSINAAGVYLAMRYVFKRDAVEIAGMLGGVQTQPAVLAFANSRTGEDPRVALGYALVYPVVMVAKIVLAQILGGM